MAALRAAVSSDCLTAVDVYVCSVVFPAPVLLTLPSSALTDQAGSGGMTAERPVIRGGDGRIPGPALWVLGWPPCSQVACASLSVQAACAWPQSWLDQQHNVTVKP